MSTHFTTEFDLDARIEELRHEVLFGTELHKKTEQLIRDVLEYVDGGGIRAKRASFQPHDHNPIKNWPIVDAEVLVLPWEQREANITNLLGDK